MHGKMLRSHRADHAGLRDAQRYLSSACPRINRVISMRQALMPPRKEDLKCRFSWLALFAFRFWMPRRVPKGDERYGQCVNDLDVVLPRKQRNV